MLKKIIGKASELKSNSSKDFLEVKNKIEKEILDFIENNKDKIKNVINNQVINENTLSLLYTILPFPIKLVISEEKFIKLILEDNPVIKETLSKLTSSSNHDEIKNTIDIDIEDKGSFLGKTKDTILAQVTKLAINSQIKKYGNLSKLDLNTTNKSIDLEIILEGEYEPLIVHIRNYEIFEENNEYVLKIHNIITSRAWIDIAVIPYIESKALKLPSKYAKIIKKVI